MPGQPFRGEEQCICGRQLRVPTQVFCLGPRKRAKGTRGQLSIRLLFSSLIYIMDLPWTSSEIESLHDCADCWKSVSQSYYPFVLCDAPRISTLRSVCRCGCRCSWEHLGKYRAALSTIYRSIYLEDYRILLSPRIYVTDDVNQSINS